MGQSIVKADIEQVSNAINNWIAKHGFVPIQEVKASNSTQIKARTLFYKARWDLSPQDSDVAISMAISIRVYLNILIHLLMIGGLTYCVYLLDPIMHQFSRKVFFPFFFTAIFAAPGIYCAMESSKHRKKEQENRKLELELASISPFLEKLDDTKAKEILEKLAPEYFGNHIVSQDGMPLVNIDSKSVETALKPILELVKLLK